VFAPDDTTAVNVREIAMQGARGFLVTGLTTIGQAGGEGERAVGWLNRIDPREHYRIGARRDDGIELAEQTQLELPDVILYPTRRRTGIHSACGKAFAELEAIGWIGRNGRAWSSSRRGCATMSRAWEEERKPPRWENATDLCAGIGPQAVGGRLILRAVRESGGCRPQVSDDAIARGGGGRGRGRADASATRVRRLAAYKQALSMGNPGGVAR